MKELTVIIPFLNEGEEIYHTVKNLRETASEKINIILINDASGDESDYEAVAALFDTVYIDHKDRRGVATSRDEAIELCSTEFFLLLDGHMRFFQRDWLELMVNELKNDKRALFCCPTVPLKKEGNVVCRDLELCTGYGAYIDIAANTSLTPIWIQNDIEPLKNVVDVPCVLGAAYATNRTYWQYLDGLKGLRSYGFDEQLISLKVWLEGGKCKLIKNIDAGHLYRKKAPYIIDQFDYYYNLLYLAELFFGYSYKYNIHKNIEKLDCDLYRKILRQLSACKLDIREQKKYYDGIFNRDINSYILLNESVKNKLLSYTN